MEELTADDIPTLEVEVEGAPVDEVDEAPVVAPPAFEVAAIEEPPVSAAKPPVCEAEPAVAQAPAKPSQLRQLSSLSLSLNPAF